MGYSGHNFGTVPHSAVGDLRASPSAQEFQQG